MNAEMSIIPNDMRVRANINFNLNSNLLFLSGMFILLFTGTSQAIDVSKQFYQENNTMRIYNNLNGITWATIQLVSISPDIDRITKEYNITAYVNYTFSDMDSFKHAFRIEKGKYGITFSRWYILKSIPYTVNDYIINSAWKSKEVYNNQTGLNETIWYWDNQTVLIGNHTEYQNKYIQFIPQNGLSVEKGESYYLRQVLFKKAELGDVRIQTNVTFFGLTENNMTWWNTSWSKKAPIRIDNTGNDTGLTWYQVNLNVTYDNDMNVNGSDLRVVNDTSGLAESYWKDENNSVNSSYFNIWFNASNIKASVWTNSTYYLYYSNPSAASASNGTNTFEFFDDFSGTSIDTSKWTVTTATGLSVIGGELKTTSQAMRLTSIPTFSSDIILETKHRYVSTPPPYGYMVGGFFISTSNGFGYLLQQTNEDNYRNDTNWVAIGTTPPSATNILLRIITHSSTADLYVLNYATGSSYHTNTGISNTVSSEPIVLGDKYDNSFQGQTEEAYWDWIRVRKYAFPEPTASLGAEEQNAIAKVQVIILS